MDERRPTEELSNNEARLHVIEQHVRRVLPEYSQMDRAEYDSYVQEEDTYDRGQILYFYPSAERGETIPRVLFIFRQNGFILNYYNTPEPSHPYTIRNKGNSIYGRRQQKWQLDETEFALERARIHMEGIDQTSDEFCSQLAGWSATGDNFITMGERLDARKAFVGSGKSFKGRGKNKWEATRYTIWDVYDENPEKATELAINRIESGDEYVGIDGIARPVEEVVREIREGTVTGQKAVLREMYKVESYERLLKDHNLL